MDFKVEKITHGRCIWMKHMHTCEFNVKIFNPPRHFDVLKELWDILDFHVTDRYPDNDVNECLSFL